MAISRFSARPDERPREAFERAGDKPSSTVCNVRFAPPSSLLLLVALAGCASRPSAPPHKTDSPQSMPAQRPAAKRAELPPGVLAEARGKQGLIRVEERDGLRLLTIDRVVQGAMRSGPKPLQSVDPVAALFRAMRPKATSALVIGLGTGRTAASLQRLKLSVQAVELEPTVIEYAKRFFGYRGSATAAEGGAFLRDTKRRFDLVLIDAFKGLEPVPHLVSPAGLNSARSRLTPGGVLIIRAVAGPPTGRPKRRFSPRLTASRILRRLPRLYREAFASGVGFEHQNIYIVHSSKAINVVSVKGMPLWPLRLGSSARPPIRLARNSKGREALLVGYLIREPSSRALALDLPHWEMGAMRFMLHGPKAETLEKRLPPAARFPTAGDIRTDGKTKNTTRSLLGDGGFKRSAVQFSPVAVALRGQLHFRSRVHPDGAWIFARGAKEERRLPYGGTLYDLTVKEIVGIYDAKTWPTLRRKVLQPIARRAGRACATARMAACLAGVQGYLTAMRKRFGVVAPLLKHFQDVERFVWGVKQWHTASAKSDFRRAACCDSAVIDPTQYQPGYDRPNPDAVQLARQLTKCRDRFLRLAVGRGNRKSQRVAAARLLYLLSGRLDLAKGREARRLKRRIARLKKRFSALKPMASPLMPPDGI